MFNEQTTPRPFSVPAPPAGSACSTLEDLVDEYGGAVVQEAANLLGVDLLELQHERNREDFIRDASHEEPSLAEDYGLIRHVTWQKMRKRTLSRLEEECSRLEASRLPTPSRDRSRGNAAVASRAKKVAEGMKDQAKRCVMALERRKRQQAEENERLAAQEREQMEQDNQARRDMLRVTRQQWQDDSQLRAAQKHATLFLHKRQQEKEVEIDRSLESAQSRRDRSLVSIATRASERAKMEERRQEEARRRRITREKQLQGERHYTEAQHAEALRAQTIIQQESMKAQEEALRRRREEAAARIQKEEERRRAQAMVMLRNEEEREKKIAESMLRTAASDHRRWVRTQRHAEETRTAARDLEERAANNLRALQEIEQRRREEALRKVERETAIRREEVRQEHAKNVAMVQRTLQGVRYRNDCKRAEWEQRIAETRAAEAEAKEATFRVRQAKQRMEAILRDMKYAQQTGNERRVVELNHELGRIAEQLESDASAEPPAPRATGETQENTAPSNAEGPR